MYTFLSLSLFLYRYVCVWVGVLHLSVPNVRHPTTAAAGAVAGSDEAIGGPAGM